MMMVVGYLLQGPAFRVVREMRQTETTGWLESMLAAFLNSGVIIIRGA